jgi:putative ABC transport system permease protein
LAVVKSELNKLPQVSDVTASSHRPTNIGSNSGGAEWDGKDPEMQLVVGMSSVDYDFIETMGIQMVAGRAFSREFPSDISDDDNAAFMINETLAELIGKESLINENLRFLGVEGPIVGIMKDFHFRSIHNEIEPLAVILYPEWFNTMLIRLVPGDVTKSIAAVETGWNQVLPNYPFEYRFLDEDFTRRYRIEIGAGQLLRYFTVLVVIISCLGLFGLSSFTAEQRTKEIGVRKVLGASITNLVILMTSQFTKLVFIAIAIAFPIAYYILNKYLGNYAYRIDLSVSVFVLSGLLAVLVAIITVSYQAIRAATVNPAQALKYE